MFGIFASSVGFYATAATPYLPEFVFPSATEIVAELNSSKKLCLIQNKSGRITIPDDFNLTLRNDEVLEIQAAGNIIFGKNVKLYHKGKGGGLILRAYYGDHKSIVGAGQIEFGKGSSINFYKSEASAVSIYYRPKANDGEHKYQCPQYFSNLIYWKKHTYFKAFMLIENESDLADACEHEGSYALGKSIEVGKEDHQKGEMLRGIFSFNSQCFKQKGWVNFKTMGASMSRLFFWKNLYKVTINSSPPYAIESQEDRLLQTASQGTLSFDCIDDFGIDDLRIIDTKGRTPIHLAAMCGHLEFLKSLPEDGLIEILQAKDLDGSTPFELASIEGHIETVAWLQSQMEYSYVREINQCFFERTSSKRPKLTINEDGGSPRRECQLDNASSRSRIVLFQNIANIAFEASKAKCQALGSTDKLPVHYKLGGEEYTVSNNPNDDQPGNVHFREVRSFEPKEIPNQVGLIVEKFPQDGDQKIAAILRKSRLRGSPITADQLVDQGYKGEYPQDDSEFLNRLGILLDLEVSRKLAKGDQFPIGVVCARAYKLIEKGHLEWKEFLTKRKSYHFFSGKKPAREAAMRKVSGLYHKMQKQKEMKKQQNRPFDLVVASAERMHRELLKQYGGSSDSEGENYDLLFPY